MSRSGYSDYEIDNWELICWRGAVASAIRGKRGQAFLRELLAALNAMPEKRLIPNDFEADGEYCTLGVIAHQRGVDLQSFLNSDDYAERDLITNGLGVAWALVAEIMYENDESRWDEAPEQRWQRMRAWVARQIKEQSDE